MAQHFLISTMPRLSGGCGHGSVGGRGRQGMVLAWCIGRDLCVCCGGRGVTVSQKSQVLVS